MREEAEKILNKHIAKIFNLSLSQVDPTKDLVLSYKTAVDAMLELSEKKDVDRDMLLKFLRWCRDYPGFMDKPFQIIVEEYLNQH